MIIKECLYSGVRDGEPVVVPLFTRGFDGFVKTASAPLLESVARYIDTLRPSPDSQYVLVNALGAGEYYGDNSHGDYFPEAALIHKPDNWSDNPLLDRIRAKDWGYGFPTFYYAHPFGHHRNKDSSRAFGEVELAAWNDHMKRVELVVRVDKSKCQEFGGVPIWDKLQNGGYIDVSMGCKVPFDTCSTILDWKTYREAQCSFDPKKHKHQGDAVLEFHKKLKEKDGRGIRGLAVTRADYCDDMLKNPRKILPDGRKIFVYNDYPRFFDISFVFVGADKTAKVMMKIAGGAKKYAFFSKTAGDEVQKKINFQGVDIHVDRPKGFEKKVDPTFTRTYHYDYGFFPKTKDADGEELDVFVGNNNKAKNVYIIDQVVDGKFDEHKVMMGFDNKAHAKQEFLRHHKPESQDTIVGGIKTVPLTQFKKDLPEEIVKKASLQDHLLKNAFLDKKAKTKISEIVKDVPATVATKAVSSLSKDEVDIPKEILNEMGKSPLGDALTTTSIMGIVLRPKEFQRVCLCCGGSGRMADDLERSGTLFPRVSSFAEPSSMGFGGGVLSDIIPKIMGMLSPMMGMRSSLSPFVGNRLIVRISSSKSTDADEQKDTKTASSLIKIGQMYNTYRQGIIHALPFFQPIFSKSQGEMRKVASLDSEELFTSLTTEYIKLAFWEEVSPLPDSLDKVAHILSSVSNM